MASSTSRKSSERLRRSRSSTPTRASSEAGSSWHRAHGPTTCTQASAASSSRSGCTGRTWLRSWTPTTTPCSVRWDTESAHDEREGACGRFLEGRETPLYLASDATSEVIAPRSTHGGCVLEDDRAGRARAGRHARWQDRVREVVEPRTKLSVNSISRRRPSLGDHPAHPVPDTLQLSANEPLLTVGLRTPPPAPAQVAVVDTGTMEVAVVTVGGMGTTAGHQWTSPNGHYTFAAFEVPLPASRSSTTAKQRGHRDVALPRSAPRTRLRPSVATFETGSFAGAELPDPVPTQSLGTWPRARFASERRACDRSSRDSHASRTPREESLQAADVSCDTPPTVAS